jgi:hypothetical protein
MNLNGPLLAARGDDQHRNDKQGHCNYGKS